MRIINYFLLLIYFGFAVNIYSLDKTSKQFYTDGCQKYKEGNYEASITDFENAVNLDSDYFNILTGNGIFDKLLQKGHKKLLISQEMIKICNNVLKEKKEKDLFIFLYLGWAKLNLNNKQDAIKNLKQALSMMKKSGLNYEFAEHLLNKANSLKG